MLLPPTPVEDATNQSSPFQTHSQDGNLASEDQLGAGISRELYKILNISMLNNY